MHTTNQIDVIGDPQRVRRRVYQLAADIQDWPAILPHYRYIRVLERSDQFKVADYGASRDGLPVSWRARQELFPDEFRITFVHTGGVTRGMWVEWRLEALSDRVHVSIDHVLDYPVPVLGALFARHIVGGLFVENIAGKTLRRLKAIVEAETPPEPG
jgi:ribosome-associated toxin RatA of RatAB toxin-antitoxin module